MSVVRMGQKGLTIYDPMKAFNGYTILFPMGTYDCWLMDMEGRYVHRWRMPYRVGNHGILLPNGNLLYAGKVKDAHEMGWPGWFGGFGGIFIELDWDSNLVW